jgi:hypothetical protein
MMFDPCTDGRPEWWEIDIDHHLADGLRLLGGGRHPGSKYFHDSSLFGNDGLLTNMDPATDWVPVPELGRWATDFGGAASSQYIQLTTKIVFGSADPWSIAWWADLDDISFGTGIVGNEYTSGKYTRFLLGTYISGYAVCNDANGHVGDSYNLTGRHHYAVISSGTAITIYRDGQLVQSPGFPSAGTWSFYRIGNHGVTSGDSVDGRVSDFGIWSGALSVSKIACLADPSNVMLSGLIPEPRRRIFPAAAAPPAGAIMNQMQGANLGADLFDGTILAA